MVGNPLCGQAVRKRLVADRGASRAGGLESDAAVLCSGSELLQGTLAAAPVLQGCSGSEVLVTEAPVAAMEQLLARLPQHCINERAYLEVLRMQRERGREGERENCLRER